MIFTVCKFDSRRGLLKGGKMKKVLNALVLSLIVLLGATQAAFAALTLPASLSVADMETVAGLLIVAVAAIWVMRKVIGFFGR